jgi:hypothetical protein
MRTDLVIEDVNKWSLIHRIFREVKDEGKTKLHIRCDCGANLWVVIGKYKDDRFVLLEEDPDPMNYVYGFECPTCRNRYKIRAKQMRVWRVS